MGNRTAMEAGASELSSTSCDVAIVGAGPAGVTTALALRRLAPTCSVVLIDAGMYQRPRHGETLLREAQAVFQHLGLWEGFCQRDMSMACGTQAAWGTSRLAFDAAFFCSPGRGWYVERPALTQWMISAARTAGVEIASGTRLVDIDSVTEGWAMRLEVRGQSRAIQSRFVVDATGRLAFVARRLGARKVRFDRLVGAFVTFQRQTYSRAEKNQADTWVEAHEMGFWYAAAQGGGRVVIGFMSDADIAQKAGIGEASAWRDLFQSSQIHAQLGPALEQQVQLPTVRAMDSHRLDRVIGEKWLAVGDAATTGDFLTSHGIREALEMGHKAASAVVDDLADRRTTLRRYQLGVEQRFEDILRHRTKIHCREQRWPEAPFWHRRHDRPFLGFDQLLTFTESKAAERQLDSLGMHLPVEQLKFLCSLCVSPRLVLAVIRAFKERYRGSPPPDHRILRALQYLVDQGLMTAE